VAPLRTDHHDPEIARLVRLELLGRYHTADSQLSRLSNSA
jgi:hypothetical protein